MVHRSGRVGVSLFLFLCLAAAVSAQSHKKTTDLWFFPGVTDQVTPATKLSAQPVWFTNAHALGTLLRAYIQVSKHITLHPGYLFMTTGVTGHMENTLLNGFIYNGWLGAIQIEDRNLLWDRLRQNAANLHFYRNRLRIIRPFTIDSHAARLYVFDETFYYFNAGRWTRNRLAVGAACDIVKKFNLDVAYVRQNDLFSGGLNLFWVMGTIQL